MKVKDLPNGKLALFAPFTNFDGTLDSLSNRAIAKVDDVIYMLTCGEHVRLPDLALWNDRDVVVIGDFTCS